MRSPLSGIQSPFGPTGRPGWLGGGLWGFTASPTPQYAHFGRSTNKAGALASGRNFASTDPQADGSYLTTPANEAAFTTRGLWGYQQLVNLVERLNPTVAQLTTASNVTDAAGFAGFGNSVRFAGGVTAGAYQRPTIANGVAFAASFLVQMEDGNAPVFGSATATSGLNTFAIIVNGATGGASPLNVVTHLVGDIWRVSAVGTAPSSNANFGIVQYNTNQNRAFRVCGYQLFAGTFAPETLVPGSSDTGGATRLADNTTIPDWQTFVERYSLLDGLTIDATANIRLTPAAARRILTIGTANDGFFLEQTTSNTIRAVLRASSADVWTMTSGVIGAAGNRRVQVTLKPGDYALTVSGGVTGASNSNATALPDDIRTNPAYVGRDIAGSLHWNGNIPSLVVGKAP